MLEFEGKVALVTGGNEGIGRTITLSLARCGADVVIDYAKNSTRAEETAAEVRAMGRRCAVMAADVTDRQAVQRLVQFTAEQMGGRIDILVNNAGDLIQRCLIAEMSEELWDRVIDVNLKSAFLCSQAVLPYMKGRGWGRIVNSSSLAAHDGGGAGACAYAAAKAGVAGFTRGLAKEFAPYGITVNSVAPGFIDGTAFHDTFTKPEVQQAVIQSIPLKRGGTPQDVAGAVLFLCSDRAAFITGELIEINGGVAFY